MSRPLITPIDAAAAADATGTGVAADLAQESPRLFGTAARSPAAAGAFAAQVEATRRYALPERSQAAIALRVAQLNGSCYGIASASARASRLGIDAQAARGFRTGRSANAKEQALLALATQAVLDRGHHAGFAVEAARRAGLSDGEIVEAIALVALQTHADYLSSVANIALDHPVPEDLGGIACHAAEGK